MASVTKKSTVILWLLGTVLFLMPETNSLNGVSTCLLLLALFQAKEVTPQHRQCNPVGILPGMTVQSVLKIDVCCCQPRKFRKVDFLLVSSCFLVSLECNSTIRYHTSLNGLLEGCSICCHLFFWVYKVHKAYKV